VATKPAVAIAVSIINAYKRRAVLTAQNADVAPTIVGVAYLRFMKNQKKKQHMCFIHSPQTHLRMQQNLAIHKSLFCLGQTRNRVECDPGPHKTTKYRIWDLCGVRKCNSGDGINDDSAFHKKLTFHTLQFNTHEDHIYDSAENMHSLKCWCG
jgi:hypothetical protein